jgi:micrococcal nuclease
MRAGAPPIMARMLRRLLPVLLTLAVGVAIALRASEADTLPPSEAVVVEVVDGDTVRVRLGDGREEPVRYIGIDTPERGEPCFQEATDANARLVEGRRVRLERDVSERDRYDRLLAYVHRVEDDLFVNEALVREGWAEAREYRPDTARAGRLEAAERGARRRC